MADALDAATGTFLENDKSPARRLGQIDNRGSHFYLAMYWAQEVANQTADTDLAAAFAPLADKLILNEAKIVEELNAVQGYSCDIGGYYFVDDALASEAMKPSATLNEALASLAVNA